MTDPKPAVDPTTDRPVFDSGEVDPGCSTCGTCLDHDGCVDKDNPPVEGDCPECGACADCITHCADTHPIARRPQEIS